MRYIEAVFFIVINATPACYQSPCVRCEHMLRFMWLWEKHTHGVYSSFINQPGKGRSYRRYSEACEEKNDPFKSISNEFEGTGRVCTDSALHVKWFYIFSFLLKTLKRDITPILTVASVFFQHTKISKMPRQRASFAIKFLRIFVVQVTYWLHAKYQDNNKSMTLSDWNLTSWVH